MNRQTHNVRPPNIPDRQQAGQQDFSVKNEIWLKAGTKAIKKTETAQPNIKNLSNVGYIVLVIGIVLFLIAE